MTDPADAQRVEEIYTAWIKAGHHYQGFLDVVGAALQAVEAERDDYKQLAEARNQGLMLNGEKIAQLTTEVERLRAALGEIVKHPHKSYEDAGGPYEMGVSDGHRCASNVAEAALAPPAP